MWKIFGGGFFGNHKNNYFSLLTCQKCQKNTLFFCAIPARPPPPSAKSATGTRSWVGPGLEQPKEVANCRPVTLIISVLFDVLGGGRKMAIFDIFYTIFANISQKYAIFSYPGPIF